VDVAAEACLIVLINALRVLAAATPVGAFAHLPEQPDLERSERDYGNKDEDDCEQHHDTST
jgi:hypothetical protein